MNYVYKDMYQPMAFKANIGIGAFMWLAFFYYGFCPVPLNKMLGGGGGGEKKTAGKGGKKKR